MRLFSTFLMLTACIISLAHAGSEPIGYSSINGYFLGFASEAYISVENPNDFGQEIENICKRKGSLWALGIESPFTCASYKIEEDDDQSTYGLILENSMQINEPTHALLFSTKPFPKPNWTFRHATKAEIDLIAITTPLKTKKYSKALENARAGKTKVVETPNGKETIFIIPWQISSDGIEEDEDFLFIRNNNVGGYVMLESRGEIVGLTDITADGIPEFQISRACDGTCESVISATIGDNVLIRISSH